MEADKTALVLIGYQNDYFADDGILNQVIASNVAQNDTLNNTLKLIKASLEQGVHVFNIPIIFSSDYSE
jgi:nicotinamidase-related amidase